MKLYILIQQLLRRKFVQYFVLFFILISIIAVIASSFEEMATYKVLLFGITYVSSFIFLIEYTARIVSAPALYPGMNTAKARLKYTFSFYGFVDFVAVLPCVLTYAYWDTEVVHVIILPYIFIIFKLIRHSRSFRIIGMALASVREELETAYTASFITICFSAILMYYIERNAQPEVFKISVTESGGPLLHLLQSDMVTFIPLPFGEIIGLYYLSGRCGNGSHSDRYH